ncbi:kinase-like domain-containing protein [Mycena metata]|uniref:Kinase-like domain-containing protein n=1 Tax=Mycena metata TaxID=1033252 RepID=A0AAD7K4W8_9AGAR|nr:kinase-like domain-containing protein [Mycena metata]
MLKRLFLRLGGDSPVPPPPPLHSATPIVASNLYDPSPATGSETSTAPKILVDEALFSFLDETCSDAIRRLTSLSKLETVDSSFKQRLDKVTQLQSTVEGYRLSMSCNDVVSAIVASLGHRITLLELSSELRLEFDDPALQIALRADERRVIALIISILDSESVETVILGLAEPESAQAFLDVVQEVLNRGLLESQEHIRRGRRLIRKISESSDRLPSSLFITGVTGRNEHPAFAGGFGDVYEASYGDKKVAVKHIRYFLASSASDIRNIRLKLYREALLWKDLRHPYILPFIGIDLKSFPSSLCLVSPFMENGTVLSYLNSYGREHVDKFLHETAKGLEYLHSQNIVHGDLRGANILVDRDKCACLTDFGLSAFDDATAPTHNSTRAGSLSWMAPELIDPGRFGLRFARTPYSDVYAFGCVCFELHTGRPPFSNVPKAIAMLRTIDGERAVRPSGSAAMADSLWQHVNAYWAQEPTSRPISEDIVKHLTPPPPPQQLRHSWSTSTVRPSGSPAMADSLWNHNNVYRAQEATSRPTSEDIVKHLTPPAPPQQLRRSWFMPILSLALSILSLALSILSLALSLALSCISILHLNGLAKTIGLCLCVGTTASFTIASTQC